MIPAGKTEPMETTVELKFENGVARVVFANAKGVHLLTEEARWQLIEVLHELESFADCRVVVFESSGRTFIAGADINELRRLERKTARSFSTEGQHLMNRIEALKPVTIAAIHAACTGGGWESALACDLRIAAKSARIGLPEVTIGILPGWGGTVRAVRLFGGAIARRMILTGELFGAEEALLLGLLDSVYDDDKFRATVEDRVTQLARCGPLAQQRVKQLILKLENRAATKLFRREARRFAECYETAEPPEGLSAFLEKRPPRWRAEFASEEANGEESSNVASE